MVEANVEDTSSLRGVGRQPWPDPTARVVSQSLHVTCCRVALRIPPAVGDDAGKDPRRRRG